MGLDVYLYHNGSGYTLDELSEAEDAWATAVDPLYTKYPTSDEEARNKRNAEAKEMFFLPNVSWAGKLVWDGPEIWNVNRFGVTGVSHPSEKYPDNINQIGYFRSSYNGAGFNSVMAMYNLPTLHDLIFGDGPDCYEYTPDWTAMADRVLEALDLMDSSSTRYMAVEVQPSMSAEVKSKSEALQAFLDEKARYQLSVEDGKALSGSYYTRGACYWLDKPLTVCAAISSNGPGFYGGPGTYLIVESEGGLHPSYRESLYVISETCEYVLKQADPHNYYLVVSG